MVEHREPKHRERRNELNDKFIGTLIDVPAIVVQGVEIRKPSWFVDAPVDIEQLTAQLGRRRAR